LLSSEGGRGGIAARRTDFRSDASGVSQRNVGVREATEIYARQAQHNQKGQQNRELGGGCCATPYLSGVI
jgi:hypothetical protein